MSWLIRSSCSARMLKPNAIIRAVALRHSSHDHKPAVPFNEPPNDHLPYKVATIDDLQTPVGDYYEDFKKQNRKYWMHFIGGVSFLAVSIYVLVTSDVVTWNAYPPPLPPKEERLTSFWVQPTYWDDEDDDEE